MRLSVCKCFCSAGSRLTFNRLYCSSSVKVFARSASSSRSTVLPLSRCENHRVKSLGIQCFLMWALAITVWISDRMFCSFWLSVSFPYLHSFWHVLILFSSNQGIAICAYLTIKQQNPQANLHLHFWPYEQWHWFTLPYLRFHDDDSSSTKATMEYIWSVCKLIYVSSVRVSPKQFLCDLIMYYIVFPLHTPNNAQLTSSLHFSVQYLPFFKRFLACISCTIDFLRFQYSRWINHGNRTHSVAFRYSL